VAEAGEKKASAAQLLARHYKLVPFGRNQQNNAAAS